MKKLCAASLMLLCMSVTLFALEVPKLNARRVNDYAGLLTASETANLENTLADYERKTSNQIAILTVRDLQGLTLEEYANTTFHSWKLGQKGKDNGVLILISVGTHNNARIEVGYGLESVLPDGTTRLIISNDMAPAFKAKKYYECLATAVSAIERAIGGEYTAAASTSSAGQSSDGSVLKVELIWGAIGAFILLILAALFSLIHRSVGGIVGGAGAFFLVNFLFVSIPLAVVAGLIGFAIGLVSKDIVSGLASMSGDGYSSSGGWSSSSDSGSSGGFGSGGGDSGGGGASGSLD